MARGLFRKPSLNKMVGAYRSQWKRTLMRLLTFGAYGSKGMGWFRDPKKAWYNWLYYRTSISIPRLLGYRPSKASFFCTMLVAAAISIFTAPVDVARAAVKAHKVRKSWKTRSSSGKAKSRSSSGSNSGMPQKANADKAKTSRSASTGIKKNNYTASASHTGSSATPAKPQKPKIKLDYAPVSSQKSAETHEHSCSPELFLSTTKMPAAPAAPAPQTAAPDENTPKSRPKHKDDQYIRKRMIIAGTSYCDKAALDKLTIGTYFELVAEPTNPHDKDAIMLVHEGEKIGYISQQDKPAFVTCLRLNRKVYGVITDIIPAPYPSKYEFETWFDKSPSTET